MHKLGRFRILHIVKGLGLGGTEKTMQLMLANLDPERFEPFVLSLADGPRRAELAGLGIPVFVDGDILRVAQKLQPHIAHIHRAGWAEPGFLRSLGLAGIPALVETNVFGRHDQSPRAASIDRHLFVSRFCLDRMREVEGVATPYPRYQVLYNPVDTDFFAQEPAPRDYPLRVAGRLSRPDPGKWSRLAFEIAPLLAARFPDFTYDVVGATPEFAAYVTEQGLGPWVNLREPLNGDPAIRDFFRDITVLAHANDSGESFGLAIAEAMAAGLPVVTHQAEGLRDNAQLELVENGRTGLIANTAADYADAVAWLFEHPAEARAMGRAGQVKAARLFRAQEIARQLGEIYLELALEKGLGEFGRV